MARTYNPLRCRGNSLRVYHDHALIYILCLQATLDFQRIQGIQGKVNERNNLSHNNNENPTNKLYDHFKRLHSAPDPNTLSAFQIHILNDKKRLEDSNHLQSIGIRQPNIY